MRRSRWALSHRWRWPGLVIVGVLAVIALSACSSNQAAGAPAQRAATGSSLKIVATTTLIQDFVRNVGGDKVMVLGVLGPGDDAHDYEPTAADARNIAQTDLILANGVGLESWLDPLTKNKKTSTPVVKLAEGANLKIAEGNEEEPEGDPHVWQDPTNVKAMVDVITFALTKARSSDSATFEKNATAYKQQLDQLDQDIKKQWENVPVSQRKLVTNHDAFGYYARRYGITIVGSVIPSISTDAEPSAVGTQKLIQAIKDQKVKAIFTEENLNPKLESQIAQQANVKVYSNLYGDSLGKKGSDGDTYLKAMQANTKNMIAGVR